MASKNEQCRNQQLATTPPRGAVVIDEELAAAIATSALQAGVLRCWRDLTFSGSAKRRRSRRQQIGQEAHRRREDLIAEETDLGYRADPNHTDPVAAAVQAAVGRVDAEQRRAEGVYEYDESGDGGPVVRWPSAWAVDDIAAILGRPNTAAAGRYREQLLRLVLTNWRRISALRAVAALLCAGVLHRQLVQLLRWWKEVARATRSGDWMWPAAAIHY